MLTASQLQPGKEYVNTVTGQRRKAVTVQVDRTYSSVTHVTWDDSPASNSYYSDRPLFEEYGWDASLAAARSQAALAALAQDQHVSALLAQLQAAQQASEADGTWDTPVGRKVEAAWGYLRMALEAAGKQF